MVAYTHIKVKRGQKAWATGQSCGKVGMFGCIHTQQVNEINIGLKGTLEHPPCPHPVYIELLTFPLLTPDIGGILCAFQADLDPDM